MIWNNYLLVLFIIISLFVYLTKLFYYSRKTTNSVRGLQLKAAKVENLEDVVHVAAAFDHAAAVTADGMCFTWGYGTRGKLGHGDTQNREAPTLVESLRN